MSKILAQQVDKGLLERRYVRTSGRRRTEYRLILRVNITGGLIMDIGKEQPPVELPWPTDDPAPEATPPPAEPEPAWEPEPA